jgi:hypothetical protein
MQGVLRRGLESRSLTAVRGTFISFSSVTEHWLGKGEFHFGLRITVTLHPIPRCCNFARKQTCAGGKTNIGDWRFFFHILWRGDHSNVPLCHRLAKVDECEGVSTKSVVRGKSRPRYGSQPATTEPKSRCHSRQAERLPQNLGQKTGTRTGCPCRGPLPQCICIRWRAGREEQGMVLRPGKSGLAAGVGLWCGCQQRLIP